MSARKDRGKAKAASPRESPRKRIERVVRQADGCTVAAAAVTNHFRDLVSLDFFTVPTARFRVLFVLVVLTHHRRRVLHFNVTEHPTAAWTTQQLVDTFPEDCAPPYL